ncbi:MAG: AP2/ERF family transcription factor [Rhizobium sp.]|uniref:AP2/ERF family transcription factor n=1 Tax=Rhizobium sp. TaxID=391 RepID=UPI00389A4AF9
MAFIVDGVAHIPLQKSKGRKRMFALIDEEDYDRVSHLKWYAVASGKTFYARATSGILSAHLYGMHSFVMRAKKGQRVDHENGNGLDNRKVNLRKATPAQNTWNSFKRSDPCSSKFKGVIFTSSGKWAASITRNGEHQVIGLFDDEAEAARAYDEKAILLFGEFAKTNDAMGLFESDRANRVTASDMLFDPRSIGEFKAATPGRIFDGNENVGDRAAVGVVIGLCKHPRTRQTMYRLDTGAKVHMDAYMGRHPSSEELAFMRASQK